MGNIELFATIMFVVQVIHSVEELSTGFHKKWFLFKMPFKVFLTFEIIHNLFWLSVLIFSGFPFRSILLYIFILLMFAQSLFHLAWWGNIKKYVPGLFTAFIHVTIFLIFYFQLLKF